MKGGSWLADIKRMVIRKYYKYYNSYNSEFLDNQSKYSEYQLNEANDNPQEHVLTKMEHIVSYICYVRLSIHRVILNVK